MFILEIKKFLSLISAAAQGWISNMQKVVKGKCWIIEIISGTLHTKFKGGSAVIYEASWYPCSLYRITHIFPSNHWNQQGGYLNTVTHNWHWQWLVFIAGSSNDRSKSLQVKLSQSTICEDTFWIKIPVCRVTAKSILLVVSYYFNHHTNKPESPTNIVTKGDVCILLFGVQNQCWKQG